MVAEDVESTASAREGDTNSVIETQEPNLAGIIAHQGQQDNLVLLPLVGVHGCDLEVVIPLELMVAPEEVEDLFPLAVVEC